MATSAIVIPGLLGESSGRKVFIAFAAANVLHNLSFADVLDEETGRGYQRPLNRQHSLDFRRYIQLENSSTIPLTFNLRPRADGAWKIVQKRPPHAVLLIDPAAGKILAQVDCQHRLGFLDDLPVMLPFMCFVGLTDREEMEVFKIINSKARGLSTSLLDFHGATLSTDLARERPELFIALHLNNDAASPWYRQLDLGGACTSGLKRRASLRTLQKAVRRFLRQTQILAKHNAEFAAHFVLEFWIATAVLLRSAWSDPRHHLINKGVGVYALMAIAADLYCEADSAGQLCDKRLMLNKLSEFIQDVDWTSSGQLGGLGGEVGVKAALVVIRGVRSAQKVRILCG